MIKLHCFTGADKFAKKLLAGRQTSLSISGWQIKLHLFFSMAQSYLKQTEYLNTKLATKYQTLRNEIGERQDSLRRLGLACSRML